MVDARGRLRFPEEAGGEHRLAGKLAMQNLERKRGAEGALPHPVHAAHRPLSDEGLDLVFSGDRAADQGVVLHEARRY